MQTDPFSDEPFLPPNTYIGNYLIEGLVAEHCLIGEFNVRGFNGAFYLMRVFSEQSLDRFPVLRLMVQWEYKALIACKSPHVLHLVESLKGEHFLFNVYNKLRFRSVGELVASEGPLPEATALKWLRQIAEGLEEINEYDYFPRILTPDSLRVHEDAAYLDIFGDDRNRFILLGQEPPWYACESPEIFENQGLRDKLETSQDVWSLGVCLYFMLFGFYPWQPVANLWQFYGLITNHAGSNLHIPQVSQPVTPATLQLLRDMIEPNRLKRLSWSELLLRLRSGTSVAYKPLLFGAPKNMLPNLLFTYDPNELSAIKPGSQSFEGLLDQSIDQKDFSVNLRDANHSLFSSLIGGKIENLITRETIITPPNQETKQSSEPPTIDGKPNKPKNSLIAGTGQLKQSQVSIDRMHASTASIYTNFNEDMHMRNSKSRYKHEAKVIYHIIDTIEEIEGMVSILKDLPASGYYSQGFLAMLLLLTKNILDKNKRMIESLQSKQNIFKMPDFEAFVQTEECKPTLKALRKDQETYNEMWAQQLMAVEKVQPKTAFLSELNQQITSPGFEFRVKEELDLWSLRLYGFYLDHGRLFAATMAKGIQQLLAKIFMSVYDESEFEFDRDGKIFNWEMLEVQFERNYLTETFKLGIEHYRKNQARAKYHNRFFLELAG